MKIQNNSTFFFFFFNSLIELSKHRVNCFLDVVKPPSLEISSHECISSHEWVALCRVWGLMTLSTHDSMPCHVGAKFLMEEALSVFNTLFLNWLELDIEERRTHPARSLQFWDYQHILLGIMFSHQPLMFLYTSLWGQHHHSCKMKDLRQKS